MDRSLKERLIGAAVLVALGVWLIPWVLDGPDSEESGTDAPIVLELPVPETGEAPRAEQTIRRQTIELNADRRTPSADAAPEAPAVVGNDPAETQEDESAEPVARTAAPSIAVTPPPAAPPAAPARAAVQPVTTAAPPRVAVERNAPTDGWMVQLGSFGDSANAQRQADRVRTFGYDPRIYEFMASGRVMYRVRVGPMETRQKAEATASALSAHGFVAQVVAPE
jgi:DedD protein